MFPRNRLLSPKKPVFKVCFLCFLCFHVSTKTRCIACENNVKHDENQHSFLNDSHGNALETAQRNILEGNKKDAHENGNNEQKRKVGLDQTLIFALVSPFFDSNNA